MSRIPARPPQRPEGPWLTLRQAAVLLGMTGAWAWRALQRRLLTRERDAGRLIMRRNAGSGRGRRYVVTMALLRRWCPELFDQGADLPQVVARAIADLQDQVDVVRQRTGSNGAVIRQHSKRLLALESRSKVVRP